MFSWLVKLMWHLTDSRDEVKFRWSDRQKSICLYTTPDTSLVFTDILVGEIIDLN